MDGWMEGWMNERMDGWMDTVDGPPLIEGRGVFVVFWSLCIGFYSISCCSRRAYGPFFKFFSPISVFFLGGGGVGGCDNVLSRAFFLAPFCWCYTLLMLRYELSSETFTRSWCYVVNFLLRPLHALDATLWTFFLDLYTLLMLRCELSS